MTLSKKSYRATRFLMWIAALSALGAAVSALPTTLQAPPSTKIIQTWQLYGYIVFAALFVLLAWRPRHYRGLWEIVIFNKVALSLTALAYRLHGGIPGTAAILIWDGFLSIVLILAYVLCRGWESGGTR